MKILKPLFYTIIFILASLFLYIITAFGLSFFAPHQPSPIKKPHSIYIIYSQMHSDIAINLKESHLPWSDYLPQLLKSKKRGYLYFGWGDKETYLNTPTWSDLQLSTALKALFVNTPSLMHVGYIDNVYRYRDLKVVEVTQKQLKKLEENILKGFGKEIKFYQKGYYSNDQFYHSDYKYNIINTCNTWTGKTLYDANISVSPWTPFAQNVIGSLP